MNEDDVNPVFCLACARTAFAAWQGWCSAGTENWTKKEKKMLALPDIPELRDGKCPTCGSTAHLPADRIYYSNYHGPYNTGLPDYFTLKIDGENSAPLPDEIFQWGKPYREKHVQRIRRRRPA